MDHWNFEQDEGQRWRWVRTSEEEERTESATSFDRRADCMLDAVRYVVQHRRAISESLNN